MWASRLRKNLFDGLVLISLLGCGSESASDEPQGQEMWVTTDVLNRRPCPATRCGVVGQYFYREQAVVLEEQAGWGRTSRYYRALCEGGVNQYVDSGNASCDESNGVREGRFAEWVSLECLSEERQADSSAGASGVKALIAGSDDYRHHSDAFAKAAEDLIRSGRCTRADFEQMGGWYKSTVNHPNAPVYFTYCGGMTIQNRIYLNVENGQVFK